MCMTHATGICYVNGQSADLADFPTVMLATRGPIRRPRTADEIYSRLGPACVRLHDKYARLMRAADRQLPEVATMHLCHNWGNGAAFRLLERYNQLAARLYPAMKRAYEAAEHRDNHGEHFHPGWCTRCNPVKPAPIVAVPAPKPAKARSAKTGACKCKLCGSKLEVSYTTNALGITQYQCSSCAFSCWGPMVPGSFARAADWLRGRAELAIGRLVSLKRNGQGIELRVKGERAPRFTYVATDTTDVRLAA